MDIVCIGPVTAITATMTAEGQRPRTKWHFLLPVRALALRRLLPLAQLVRKATIGHKPPLQAPSYFSP